MNIVRDDADRWRFLKLIRYLNDANVPRNWERDISPSNIKEGFSRPAHWAKAAPHVNVLAFCLLDNHFHLLLQERTDGGISRFMHRVCTSMSAYWNAKYEDSGTLFEGTFQARVIDSDEYLQYLAAYIHLKNPLERYPGGFNRAAEHLEDAIAWALEYPFSGLRAHFNQKSALIDEESFKILSSGAEFKRFARDVILGRQLSEEWTLLSIDNA